MGRFRRVLLVNPPKTEQGGYTPSPLGLLYLAAYLRERIKGICLAVVDGAVEGEEKISSVLHDFRPDMVGVSVLTPGRYQALRVARLAKKLNPRCKVVFGGIHPTLLWQQIMEHYPEVDYIIRGEGEVTLFELVSGIRAEKIEGLVWRKNKRLVKNPDRKLIADLDSVPFPAWDLVDLSKYPARGEGIVQGIDLEKESRFSMIFSRGCMGACTFCSSWMVWRGYRARSGRNVALELEELVKKYKAKHINFYDDTLTGNRREIISFCKEIVKRRLKVALMGVTRVDMVDEEMLGWMKRAGFYDLGFGIESGSPAMLVKINKRTDLEMVKKAVFLTKKAGMRATALMMYGLPGETMRDRRLNKKLLKQIQATYVGTLGEVWIFPGTALYEQAKHAGLIDDRFWLGKRPYYIYRGGIGDDPFRLRECIKDFIVFHFADTSLNRLRIKALSMVNRMKS